MLVELDKSVFVERYSSELDYILQSGIQGFIYVNFDIEDPDVEEWLKSNNEDWYGVLDTYLSDSSSFKIENIVIVKDIEESNFDSEIPIVTPSDGVIISKKPIELYLENSRNDKNFIKLILNQDERDLFSRLENNELLSFSSGGVDELYQILCGNVSKKGRRNKRFVLIDSDATAPNAISSSATKIKEHCQENNIFHHILERRAIENYLPIQYLIEKLRPEHQVCTNDDYKKYTTYLSMTREQRHHFHMKSGFKDQSCRNSGLYDVECPNLQTLKEGFSKKYADKFLDSLSDYDKIHDIIRLDGESDELIAVSKKIMSYIRLPL
ncbi:hypothetical protein [Vibrio vulnificus]|uniref:hypothetical protein n=1 Tax=Vibrio vulnificus TaxID=672 RepID=UPI00159366F6|nr:hypothetical protein [Vibrio vulnificus]EID4388071.1 hypothetical protein [Vibrio vulnificus]NVC73122.1 hypothetical protein [Vibrio vulnificus]